MAALQKSVPLREWIESEANIQQLPLGDRQDKVNVNPMRHKYEMIIRKVTVAYGISEALKYVSDGRGGAAKEAAMESPGINCSVDNFAVRVSEKVTTPSQAATLFNIEGVDMLSPQISLQITEPSFLSGSSLGDTYQYEMGRYLEVEILNELSSTGAPTVVPRPNLEETRTLFSFGQLLHEIFSSIDAPAEAFSNDGKANRKSGSDTTFQEPARKKKARHETWGRVVQTEESKSAASQNMLLQELGFPSSLSSLVQNLLECREKAKDAYEDLNTASSDLHLLLLEPERFLFDLAFTPDNNGKVQLQIRNDKLYGRETEVSQIQEAFCRVSSGQSEAFFIGGFSGSGKTRLVESVRTQVDVAGGYVVTQKFDQMSKGRPLLEVIKALNGLCLLIKERNSPHDLDVTAANLLEAFGSDIFALARLLPNLSLILPKLEKSGSYNLNDSDLVNFKSVGFVFQRFVRVVTSKSRPLMLFLDDLQWCDRSTLRVIEGILTDTEGESFLFFVGSYRSNEVRHDHPLCRFMDNLDRCGAVSTKLSLFGINYNDLNTMTSDAMGLFPRLCANLSDIIFQKTKGNPFFTLEFLRLLVDRNLLEYSFRRRRWVWDEGAIKSTDISDNVLSLLTNKMLQLSDKVQSTLKVVSCFGFGIHEDVIDLLGSSAQYSTIREGLEELTWLSFMATEAGDSTSSSGRTWKFIHDKVREAAYSLIKEEDKEKYHEDLGQLLYSVSQGKEKLGKAVFPVVDLINRGLQPILQIPSMRIAIAELNAEAGEKCCEQSDFSTANAYFNKALSLLPEDHWARHYNLSLQLHFLSAKSAHLCRNGEDVCAALQVVLKEGHCIEDKVDAYFLLVNIYQSREQPENAYLTCLEVLAELGEKDYFDETLPNYCDGKDIASMVAKIIKNLETNTEKEKMTIDGGRASRISSIMKFYSFITCLAFFSKPEVIMPICCRMAELTLAHGMTKHSMIGLLTYSAALCQRSSCNSQMAAHAQGPCHIAKIAILWFNRNESPDIFARAYLTYYGFIAHYTDPIQHCNKWLKRAFDAGMSNGDPFSAFFSAMHSIRLSLLSGGKLSTILRESEYYVTLAGQYDNKMVRKFLMMYQQTIRLLIDRGASTETGDGADGFSQSESICDERMAETLNFHKALQSFWLGYAERCHHYVLKLDQISSVTGRHHRLVIAFYHGISSFAMLKRQRTSKLKKIPKEALVALKEAAKDSKWNYGNKAHLLEAELSSYEGRNEEAHSLYAAAIIASRSSRFIHEQGLTCELAGFHFKKIGDLQRAYGFFNQAKICYAEWGSEMKVDFITRQLAMLGDGNR